MRRSHVILISFLLCTMVSESQNNETTLDFWIGKWDAYWSDSLRGTNVITKTLKDKVVEENFNYNDNSFNGKSWSVFDPNTKLWKQTWVDDNGAYIVLTGGKTGNDVILNTTEARVVKGKTVFMRMVFYNIQKDSFDWDWQSSEDKEKWTSLWAIKYKRKKD